MTPAVIDAIFAVAAEHRIEPETITAFAMVESSGDPAARRYEPSTWRYVDCGGLLKTAVYAGVTEGEELWEQMCSWGLLQLMGFNARLMGFRGRLQDIQGNAVLGLDLACEWMTHMARSYPEIPKAEPLRFSEALACAWNHGRPAKGQDGTWVVQGYVDKVRQAYGQVTGRSPAGNNVSGSI